MELPKVNMALYQSNPMRFELRSGEAEASPLCPYGNKYEWIGFDLERNEHVRFTTSVFKKLVRKNDK